MKSVRSIFIGLTCLGMATASFAQEKETTPEATTYKAEIFGSVASGDNTPFWMVSNRYGIVPLEANNGYLYSLKGLFTDVPRISAARSSEIDISVVSSVIAISLSNKYMPS